MIVNHVYGSVDEEKLNATFPHHFSEGQKVKFKTGIKGKFKEGVIEKTGYTSEGALPEADCNNRMRKGGATVHCYLIAGEWYYHYEIRRL